MISSTTDDVTIQLGINGHNVRNPTTYLPKTQTGNYYTRQMILGYTHAGDGVYRKKEETKPSLVIGVKQSAKMVQESRSYRSMAASHCVQDTSSGTRGCLETDRRDTRGK